MRRLLPLALAASLLSIPFDAPLAAQGRGAFQAGFQTTDLASLNARLVGAGYPTFDEEFLTLGGFGLGSVGRLLIGGEGHALMPLENTTDDGVYRTRLSGGYGMFNLGVMAVSTRALDVYPVFGIGGGGMSLEVIERSSPTFDDVLDEPGRSSRLTESGFLVSASLGVDYRFGADRRSRRWDRRRDHDRDRDRGNDDGGGGGLFVGVRAGWLWAPGDAQWELDALNEVAQGPEVGPTGLFVRVSIGGWGGR